jgi:hypothetical protein
MKDHVRREEAFMNILQQQQLRQMAESMVETENTDQHALAQGALDLLDYTDELNDALEAATEACCEALSQAYDHHSCGLHIIHTSSQDFAAVTHGRVAA